MKIESESLISHPMDLVFASYRDRLPHLASYIPDIKEIVVRRRAEDGGRVRLHNEWIADRDVPAFARTIIKPEMLRWDDFAEWHVDGRFCRWTLKTRVFTEAVTCSGQTSFHASGGGTVIRLNGDLGLDLKKIKGVPRIMAGTMGPKIESFVVSLITPNLERVNSALQSFLDDEA